MLFGFKAREKVRVISKENYGSINYGVRRATLVDAASRGRVFFVRERVFDPRNYKEAIRLGDFYTIYAEDLEHAV